MNVFVTGGSGFVGGHLIERLVREGHTVRALARSASSVAAVQGYGAIAAEGELGRLPELRGTDVIIHAAAYAEDWGAREDYVRANVDGTRDLLEAARKAGVPRFVLVSTEAVLFDGAPLVDIDESAPIPASHRFLYPETKAAAEKLVLGANAPGFTTLAIRPRFVWGPRDRSVLPTVLRMAADGGFWWIDHGAQRTSTCHVDNLVEALVLSLQKGEGGHAYFVTDGEERSVHEVLTTLAGTAGVALPQRSLPSGLGRGLASVVEGGWRLLGRTARTPMTKFAISMMSVSVTVRDDAARRDLGYRPIRTVAEGLAGMRA